jgi:[acyl-carrier-protein] S-malonyltransferase
MCAGQGAHVDGASEALVAAEAPELLEELARLGASDCFQHAETSTACAQPAIFCTTVASARRYLRADTSDFAAGHSLGEYSALVTAGALDPLVGLRLVVLRGHLMQKAAERGAPNGMLAARAGVADVANVLSEMSSVAIANDNGPHQVVLAGELTALAEAAAMLRARRIRSTPLAVTGAFHHPLMNTVAERMAPAIATVEFGKPLFTVMSGLTARPFANIPVELLAAITARVRWREIMRWLLNAGVTRYVDLGPSRVLAVLAAKSSGGHRIEVA